MKRIIFIIIPILLICITACSFVRTVPKIKESELPESCEGLVPLIKKKWKKNRAQDYYRYDEEFLNKVQNEYKGCILKLSVDEVIKLFGNTPIKLLGDNFRVWGKHFLLYYLNPGCIGYPQDCKVLNFQLKDGMIVRIYVSDYVFIEEKD